MMKMVKRTYALPPDTLRRFEKNVGRGRRSSVVAELLRQWTEEQEQEALRRDIAEGCEDMADVYLEMEREFHPLEEEVARAFDE